MSQSKAISPLAAGVWFALASASLFAIRPIVVKLVYEQGTDSTTLIAYRMLFSMPIYVVLLVIFLSDPERRARLTLGRVVGTSLVGLLGYYSASYLDLLGLQYVSAQLGRMLLYVYPTFVVILGALFFGKKISPTIVLSLFITYTGIAIIFGHDLAVFGDDVVTGALFIFASALSFALYLLFSKKLITELGSRVFTCIALISASLAILLHYSITHTISEPQLNQQALWLIVFIALFCTVIPSFFTAAAVERIGADRTGIIAMVGPAITSLFAVLVLSEKFTVYHAIGIAITVFGIWVLNHRRSTADKL